MNKIIKISFAAIIPAMALLSCSENDWNDRYLDGFKDGPSYSNPSTGAVTLSAEDYSTISTLLKAVAGNDAETTAANAIKTNMYFDATSPFPASVAIPYYLASTSSEFFNFANGSTVAVSYSEISGTPEELSQISAASTYTLNSTNYKSVWGSDTDYINSFAPERTADQYLPAILKAQYPDAQEGDYAVVTYNTSTQNPVFGTGEESYEITDNIKELSVGGMLNAVAVVTAQCSRGLILTDNAGSILYYNTAVDLSEYPIGTIVKVSGEIADYNKGFQLANTASINVVGNTEVTYPEPTFYSAAMINQAVTGTTDQLAQYIKLQGQLSISGNYLNIIIDGTQVQGSVYYATPEIQASLENGKSYIFTGYFTSFTNKYLYMIVTEATPLIDVELSDSIKNLSTGDNLTATAVVTGQCSRGLILTDNAGSILYYNQNIDLASYPLGTAVKVSGAVSNYNKGLQLSAAASLEILGQTAFSYPEPVVYSASMIDTAVAGTSDILAQYSQIEGQLSISGNYLNVIIDGTVVQGSVYYATSTLQSKLENGVSYIFTGYFTSFTAKYFYMVVTDATPVASTAAYSAPSTRSALFTPAIAEENAVYYYNGSAWAPAEDVAVLNPADYAAMGDSNNSITNPAYKIPIYLKNTYPYAEEGQEMYVAYNITGNGCTCGLFVYDGISWSLNNNGMEELTAQFTKTNGSWHFTKYLGKAIFSLYNEQEIALNRTYIIAYGTAAATAVPTSNSYGYLQKTDVLPVDGVITMSNDANGFSFATECTYNGNTYTTPEGTFIIRDSNGRYLYLQGTYASFNVRADNPYIEDGAIASGYLFSATNSGDGAWTIKNQFNGRIVYFSEGYSNFAAYDSASATDHLPNLYLLEE